MTPAESMQSHLAAISEDLAEAVEAQTAMAGSLEELATKQQQVIDQIVELRAEVGQMIALFRSYVTETQALRTEAISLRSEVREIKRASGQR